MIVITPIVVTVETPAWTIPIIPIVPTPAPTGIPTYIPTRAIPIVPTPTPTWAIPVIPTPIIAVPKVIPISPAPIIVVYIYRYSLVIIAPSGIASVINLSIADRVIANIAIVVHISKYFRFFIEIAEIFFVFVAFRIVYSSIFGFFVFGIPVNTIVIIRTVLVRTTRGSHNCQYSQNGKEGQSSAE
jgi:hypothetical protein